MPALIEYLIKLSICLAVVYIFYQLFLRRLTFYNWNRWYLLGYATLSFIIPLINIMPQLQKREMATAEIITWIPAWNGSPQPQNIWEILSYWDWSLIVLAIGSLFFLIKLAVKLISFSRMKKKAILLSKKETSLYQLNGNITPFSFGNAIFINQNLHTAEELQEIIRHEFVHVKQKHTIDIIFCELLCITNWFNPFAWLIRHSIKQNLEFIADDKVVQNGFDKKEYQYLLLKVMGNTQFAFTNHFNFSSLKKRIAMMNTLKSAKVHLLKFMFLLPVIAVLLLSFRKEMQKAEMPVTNFAKRDTIPEADTAYKISVITTQGGLNNPKMERTIIDRMSVDDWNKNKENYEKKYGKIGILKISEHKNKEGKVIKYDSVYVTKYKPKPIDPNTVVLIDGKESTRAEMDKLNPDEIKEISILKDASEAGRKGVIIITTKKGVNSASPKITDSLKGKVGNIIIRPRNGQPGDSLVFKEKSTAISIDGNSNPLMILDGKEISRSEFQNVAPEKIKSISVLKDESAISLYGEKGKNGVIILKTQDKTKKSATYLSADSVAINENGTIVFKGNVSGIVNKTDKNQLNFQGLAVNTNKHETDPLVVVNGREITNAELKIIKSESIKEISILKDKKEKNLTPSTDKYGDKGKNGVIEITTKKKEAGQK